MEIIMEKEILNLKKRKEETLNAVVQYVLNTIKSKSLYSHGGWDAVNKEFSDKERFNHNFSISATAICMKLRENKQEINMPIQSNMALIEKAVNSAYNTYLVEYFVNGKNHALKIII